MSHPDDLVCLLCLDDPYSRHGTLGLRFSSYSLLKVHLYKTKDHSSKVRLRNLLAVKYNVDRMHFDLSTLLSWLKIVPFLGDTDMYERCVFCILDPNTHDHGPLPAPQTEQTVSVGCTS